MMLCSDAHDLGDGLSKDEVGGSKVRNVAPTSSYPCSRSRIAATVESMPPDIPMRTRLLISAIYRLSFTIGRLTID